MELLIKLVLCYLLGSVSGSMLMGKLKGVDIRKMGSGNAGSTNAFRTMGGAFAFGVIFIDIGVAWDDKYPSIWGESNWDELNQKNVDYTGWVMSYGFGPRFIFLGFPWKLDFAWNYNPYLGIISDRQWYLTIGLDF